MRLHEELRRIPSCSPHELCRAARMEIEIARTVVDTAAQGHPDIATSIVRLELCRCDACIARRPRGRRRQTRPIQGRMTRSQLYLATARGSTGSCWRCKTIIGPFWALEYLTRHDRLDFVGQDILCWKFIITLVLYLPHIVTSAEKDGCDYYYKYRLNSILLVCSLFQVVLLGTTLIIDDGRLRVQGDLFPAIRLRGSTCACSSVLDRVL